MGAKQRSKQPQNRVEMPRNWPAPVYRTTTYQTLTGALCPVASGPRAPCVALCLQVGPRGCSQNVGRKGLMHTSLRENFADREGASLFEFQNSFTAARGPFTYARRKDL